MSKARSIKTDLEQYLTELDKQYGNNKVSIKIPITATDPVISPLKKPVKELIKDANAEMYQTELDKQYGNALPAADSNPAVKTVKKTAKEMIAEANPELYQTITNTEQIAKANPEAASATVQPTATTKKSSPLIKNMTETFQNKVKEQYGVDVGVTSPGMMLDNTTGKEVPVPDPTPMMYAQQQEIASPEPQVQAPDIAYKESAEQMAGITPAEPEVDKTTTTYGQQDVVDTGSSASSGSDVMDYDTWYYLDQIKRLREEGAKERYDLSKQYAQNQYDQAMYGAAVAEQKAINDAQNAYALRRATYGAQGESLGRNGLAMSGYSDYADQAAYAASRGEIAGAGAVRAGTEQQAFSDYQNYLLNAELARKQTEEDAGVSYLEAAAKYQAEHDNQLAQYEAALEAQRMQNAEDVYSAMSDDPTAYSREQIQALIDGGQLTQEQGDNALQFIDNYDTSVSNWLGNVERYLGTIGQYSDVNKMLEQFETFIEGEYASNDLTQDAYQSAYAIFAKKYASNVDESNYVDMAKKMKELREEGKLSDEGYVNALRTMNSKFNYTVAPFKAVLKNNILVVEDGYNDIELVRKGLLNQDLTQGFKGIGNQMSDFLDAYVGDQFGSIAGKDGHVYIRLDKGWYELRDDFGSQIADMIVGLTNTDHKVDRIIKKMGL